MRHTTVRPFLIPYTLYLIPIIIIIIEFLLVIPGMALGVLGARILDGEKFLTRLDPSWWGVKIVRRFSETPTRSIIQRPCARRNVII